ncbi:MAG: DUF1501 domain-containing protein [Roseibacillus sp.]|nr:DUF1501 domain-containing protein [Roseibacillus sp.]
MNPQLLHATRRDFLTTSASGLGGLALAHLLARDGALGATSDGFHHFAPKAKRCIFIFMAGAPSQLDLFDYKPKLNELNGKKMDPALLAKMRFAFLQKESATLMGTKRQFAQHGDSGMWFSDLLPHLATCADDLCMVKSLHTSQFNHHPGQLMMQCGDPHFGLPSMGSWMTYGLGSENDNLPGYVVLTAGRGSSGGATLYQSGFLPSSYAGVRFRNGEEPVLNLRSPAGISPGVQRRGLDALRELNALANEQAHDPEIASRIAAYELAFRMQSAAPQLNDLSHESPKTLEAYGVERSDPKNGGRGKGSSNKTWATFARNCLLARRMAERGVRFVNLIHASWDHHSNLDPELEFNAGMSDQPIAALIKDLKDRGLLDETLVVWGSEFGRTPLGENRPGRKGVTGRDHHPNAFTMFMAGGGVKGGLNYGETDDIGWEPARDPVHVNDFHATLLHLFGLDHLKLTYRHGGADKRLTSLTRESKVIHDWIA